MSFHLGKPIIAMIVVALAGGVAISLRPRTSPRADLVLWVFAESHQKSYCGDPADASPSPLRTFAEKTKRSVDVELIYDRALNVRLVSMFMSGLRGPTVPDLVEVEIGRVGKFFRPPAQDVGFLPLNNYLATHGAREISSLADPGQKGWNARLLADGRIYSHDGMAWRINPSRSRPDMWADRIVHNRFAPYSKGHTIFGIPHDMHPMGIAYRHDLFTAAGIDLLVESSNADRPLTWTRFQELCSKFRRYWAARGVTDRHAIELRTTGVDDLLVMLLQRGLNLMDHDSRVLFTRPKFAQTVAFYAQLVAGEGAIGAQSGNTEAAASRDLNDGNICAYLTADWRVRELKSWSDTDPVTGGKTLAGKMRMIPLPIFDPGDARTGTWGGTMIAIPRACPRPDDAWELIEHLYFSKEALQARIRQSDILPPLMEQWDDPAYDRPDPFFGGQRVNRLLIELAKEIPQRWVTPASNAAGAHLTIILNRATAYIRQHGATGLEQQVARWLEEAAADLQRRIEWGKFQ